MVSEDQNQPAPLPERQKLLNDLTRFRVGVAGDSVVATNYLGLTGSNVLVGGPGGQLDLLTQNGYRVALSGLFGWLVEEERWPGNPVAHVRPVEGGEKTRERRALSARRETSATSQRVRPLLSGPMRWQVARRVTS